MTTETKVLRVITRLNIGGPARHVAILNERLPERGYTSHLITGVEGDREGKLAAPGSVETITHLKRELSPRDDIRAYRAIASIVAASQPEIVHTHLAKAGAIGRSAAIRARVPVIIHTFHGHVLEGYFSRAKSAAFLAVERALAKRTDALIAVSDAIRDQLLDLGVGTPRKWHVVPLGLDLGPLLSLAPTSDAREQFGLDSSRPVVAIVGRLTAVKDHDAFLQVAQIMSARGSDAQFVVAGDGEERPRLEAEARKTGLDIRFLGWVTDLPELYAAIDVVALTSRNEGTPVALIEAAAAGIPSVATRVGGVADVVRHEETGFLVDHGDIEGMARSVEALLGDAPMRIRFGEAARSWARDRFAAERLVNDIEELYGYLRGKKSV